MIGSGRGRHGGGRRCSGLRDDDEFERFSVDLELHFIVVELELCVRELAGLFPESLADSNPIPAQSL